MELTVDIHHEAAGYWSQVRELPGCFASGGTLSELRAALAEAIGLYLWDVPAELGDGDLFVGEVQVEVIPPAGARDPKV